MLPDLHIPRAGHLPLLTVIDTVLPVTTPTLRLNYKDVDWPKYSSTFTNHVTSLRLDTRALPTTPQELDDFVKDLMLAFQLTSAKHVPKALRSPFAKHWWMCELTALCKAYAQASRAEFTARGDESWPAAKEACSEARNKYIATLSHTKAAHWKMWLEDITEVDIWHASRYASGGLRDGSTQCIPTLRAPPDAPSPVQEYSTPGEKCRLLSSTFFPPKPPQAPTLPGDNGPFPTPLSFSVPTINQVRCSILKLWPHKAPRPDKIPNIALHQTVASVALLLHKYLLAILAMKYFPAVWWSWLTIVLQKPNCPDYTVAKAYRPIMLYNMMGKVVSSVITDELVYLTMRHSLLPAKCFGGLPSRTTTDSLLYLVHNIKNAWCRRKVVTIIFLDIASTFPNAMTD